MTTGILSYGDADVASMNAALENFAGASVNGLSLCCTPIELLSNDGNEAIISTASGFFWTHNGAANLVTNWHVLSGRNTFTGKLLSPMGYIPTRFAYYGVGYVVQGKVLEFRRQRRIVTITPAARERLESPPSINGQNIDVLTVPISSDTVFGRDAAAKGFRGAGDATCFMNEAADQRIVTRAGDDCFILGYPLKNYAGLKPPIWKRGSVSSETIIGVDGKPIFLVDAATTPAMSGSPIVRKAVGFTADNKDIGAIQEFTSFDVIGVYSGRLQSDELISTNIGYGWYKTLIPKIIEKFAEQARLS